jgi:hypothetical protein
MQLIIFLFYVHKLINYIDLPDDLPDNSLYILSVKSTQDYVYMHGATYQIAPMYFLLEVNTMTFVFEGIFKHINLS